MIRFYPAWTLTLTLLVLCSCGDDDPQTDDSQDKVQADPFVETLDPDSIHFLATSLPFYPTEANAVSEFSVDFQERWFYDVKDGGAMGAWRAADGSTLLGQSGFPPQFNSSATYVDPKGNVIFSYNDIFMLGLGFTHGVVATPEGNFIALDSTGSRVVSFDAKGTVLWERLSDNQAMPNAVAIHTNDQGVTQLALVERRKTGMDEIADRVSLLELQDSTTLPVEIWRVQLATSTGRGLIPHGVHFNDDDTLTVCESAAGLVLAFNLDGEQLWRLPQADEPVRFAFPRDAVFLPDGSLLVVDGEDEILRIWDPFGRFEIVSAMHVPGAFSVHPIPCGAGGGLPCLGSP